MTHNVLGAALPNTLQLRRPVNRVSPLQGTEGLKLEGIWFA